MTISLESYSDSAATSSRRSTMAMRLHLQCPPVVWHSHSQARLFAAYETLYRAQRMAARRQKPSRQESGRKPGSNRWAKANGRAAKKRRRAAYLRRAIAHRVSRVLADKHTHVALERLAIPNMTRSARGTAENPGRNIRQKSGLNRSILSQNWGMPALFLQYRLGGGIVWVEPRRTSQACHMCGAADHDNRRAGRLRAPRAATFAMPTATPHSTSKNAACRRSACHAPMLRGVWTRRALAQAS